MSPKLWSVIRHSGRGAMPPRVAYRGREPFARAHYERTRRDLRAGSVLLLDHAGGVQGYHWGRP